MRTLIFLTVFLLSNSLFSHDTTHIEKVSRNPYYKYVATEIGDTITYYLSEFDKDKELPLLVFIQGSGYNSLFSKQETSIIPKSGHIGLTHLSQGKAKVLIVEKPGVNFLDNLLPDQSNQKFDTLFSLESWSKRIEKVILQVLSSEKIDSNKIMLVGHSEGGVVAARVANIMNDKISNVTIIAGEGTSQLYSLFKFADNGTFFNTDSHNMPTSEQRLKYIADKWKDILADPDNTDKKFWGFTYLRWSSMLKTSVIDELTTYNGKILLVQGLTDKAVHPESAIISYTTLLSKERNVKLELIENADHSFNISNEPDINGWKMVLELAINWFLE